MIKNKNKGFTLIELLIVIAIIAILSTVVMVAINSARTKSKNGAIVSQLNQARNQAELYYTHKNNYNELCKNSLGMDLESEDLGIYPYLGEALRIMGVETNDEITGLIKTEKIETSGATGWIQLQNSEQYGGMAQVANARCHVSLGDYSNPRWAAQAPLLKNRKGDNQEYYCVDSTGTGITTTISLGSSDASTGDYLECIPSL